MIQFNIMLSYLKYYLIYIYSCSLFCEFVTTVENWLTVNDTWVIDSFNWMVTIEHL